MRKLSFREVEQAFEKLQELNNAPLTYIAAVCWIIISIVIIIHLVRDWKTLSIGAIGIRVISLAASCYAVFHLYTNIIEYDFSLNEEKWQQDYLLPYLDSQPEETLAVEQVKATNTDGDKAIPSIHLKKGSPSIHVKFTIVDKDGSKQEISTNVKVKEAPANTSPYITHKTIKGDISEEYTAEMYYEPTLYIDKESTLYH